VPLSIIFPYARESLADRLNAYGGLLRLQEIGALMEQLAAALNHMNEHGVIHRDVKPADILLHSSVLAPMRVLLCDYGLARLIHVADTPRLQTQPYRALEMELGRSPTMAVDTWSMGCIF
jgi:serine/threonine protein kinase